MQTISVIISTVGRPKETINCVTSLLANHYQKSEIIVVEQQGDGVLQRELATIVNQPVKIPIHYYNLSALGLCRARNFGIQKAKGNIIAFTDDDCIAHKSWLKTITEAFRSNKDAMGVFGKTLPYQPKLHMGQQCPSLFSYPNERLIHAPALHWKFIGLGNNMAFDRRAFSSVGNFREWLGHGSAGMSADDGELALRILTKGYKLFYTPKAKIFHNRWLDQKQAAKLYHAYDCGEMACYGYFFFQGYQFSKPIIHNNISNLTYEAKGVFKSLISIDVATLNKFLHLLSRFSGRMRGLLIGLYYSQFDPVEKI